MVFQKVHWNRTLSYFTLRCSWNKNPKMRMLEISFLPKKSDFYKMILMINTHKFSVWWSFCFQFEFMLQWTNSLISCNYYRNYDLISEWVTLYQSLSYNDLYTARLNGHASIHWLIHSFSWVFPWHQVWR